MDVRQCRSCRKLFQYIGSPICPSCVDEEERLFKAVRNFIYENPSSSIDEIREETGADSALISRWLREGRLILSAENAALLKCEACGQPIRSGRYCEACTASMKGQLQSAAKTISPRQDTRDKAPESRPGARMHVDFRKK